MASGVSSMHKKVCCLSSYVLFEFVSSVCLLILVFKICLKTNNVAYIYNFGFDFGQGEGGGRGEGGEHHKTCQMDPCSGLHWHLII